MIIGLSGYAQSGKDTVAEMLCLNYKYHRRAFADPMRDAIYTLNPIVFNLNSRVADLVDEHGWDVAKANPEVRRLLQVFGTEVGRKMFNLNFWVDIALAGLNDTHRVVLADVRFPNEAEAIKNLGGQVVRINRHNYTPVNGHISEHAMDNYMFEHVIYNDGTLDDLSYDVSLLAKELNLG
jgi:hypothetical protein